MSCVTLSTPEFLRLTPKGSLKYDRKSLEGSNLNSTIENISEDVFAISFSPTKISPVKPKCHPISESSYLSRSSSKSDVDCSIDFDDSSDYIDLHVNESDLEFLEIDLSYKKELSKAVADKLELFKDHKNFIENKSFQELNVINHRKSEKHSKHVEDAQLQKIKAIEKIAMKQKEEEESSRQRKKLLHDKIKEAELKQQRMEEQKQAEEIERLQRLSTIEQGYKLCKKVLVQIKTRVESCEFKDLISSDALNVINNLTSSITKMWEMMQMAENGVTNSNEDVAFVQSTTAVLQLYVQSLLHEIESANVKGKKLQREKEEEIKKNTVSEANSTNADAAQNNVEAKDEKHKLKKYISIDSIDPYFKLQELLKSYEESLKAFRENTALKKYRFDLQKAINTIVNTIGKTSGSHLRDKMNRLVQLLSGKPVNVGNKRVSVNDHADGVRFCKELLARRLVKQGEEQVASNHESAYAFSAVILTIFVEFPDVGELVLAHFHQKCPYIVPYYIPKQENQSDEDYFAALGYLVSSNNTIEAQDMFLKRMSGLVRLYAAIIISPVPSRGFQQNDSGNPHGLNQAWSLVSRTLNLDPRSEITATMLYNFLEVAGNAMFQSYGKQFLKLLHYLSHEYFPKIKKVTPGNASGPVSRLERLLQMALSNKGVIATPNGTLTQRFWNS